MTSTAKAILGQTLIGGLYLAAACATLDSRSDYDRSVDFTRYHSFALLPGKLVRDDGLPPGASENTLVKQRIAAAIVANLTAKGLRHSQQYPDLLVGYVAGARSRQELASMEPYDPMLGPGWDSWWGPEALYSYEYQQGTLIIDLVDAARRALVWRSITEAERDRLAQLGEPALIQQAVARALEEFPPRK